MLWILAIGGLIVGIFGIVFLFIVLMGSLMEWEFDRHDRRSVINCLRMLVIGVVACFAGSIGLSIIEETYILSSSETIEYNLLSLKDNYQTVVSGGGTFLYVQISSETDNVYTFYYQDSDGSYKQKSVTEGDNVSISIFEIENSEEAHIVETINHYSSNHHILSDILAFGISMSHGTKTNYTIYVPEGTIVNEFVLDAE